jgi:hypothetical protein
LASDTLPKPWALSKVHVALSSGAPEALWLAHANSATNNMIENCMVVFHIETAAENLQTPSLARRRTASTAGAA